MKSCYAKFIALYLLLVDSSLGAQCKWQERKRRGIAQIEKSNDWGFQPRKDSWGWPVDLSNQYCQEPAIQVKVHRDWRRSGHIGRRWGVIF